MLGVQKGVGLITAIGHESVNAWSVKGVGTGRRVWGRLGVGGGGLGLSVA